MEIMRPGKEPSAFTQRLIRFGDKIVEIMDKLDFSTPAEGPLRSQASGMFKDSIAPNQTARAIEADLSDFTNEDLRGLAWGVKNLPKPEANPTQHPDLPPSA